MNYRQNVSKSILTRILLSSDIVLMPKEFFNSEEYSVASKQKCCEVSGMTHYSSSKMSKTGCLKT